MRFINRIIAALAMLAVVSGLMTAIAATPASAADSSGTEATFSSAFKGNASADANANAVAIAGADARGKILLEEERTRSPHDVLRKLKTPTESEVEKYATSVYNMNQAQAVLTKEVAKYDKLVKRSKVKVAKLKLRIKHKDGDVPKLKKKLKKAKKFAKTVKTSWKHKPLLKGERGFCGRNTGRNDLLVLTSFVDCVKGNDEYIVLGWVPELRDVVVVGKKDIGRAYESGCINFYYFDIPPGTPDESLFLVVKSIAEVVVDVYVAVGVNGQLVVVGELKQNGETCDREEQTVPVNQVGVTKHVEVRGMSIDKAIAFAENQVQASASATAEAKANVQNSVEFSVSKTMTLSCPPTEKPVWMQFREFNDLEVNWTDDHCVTVSFPSGSGTITWDAIYGSFATPTMPAKSGEPVCNWYKAPSEVPAGGTDTISVTASDTNPVYGTIGPRSTQPFRVDPKVTHPE